MRAGRVSLTFDREFGIGGWFLGMRRGGLRLFSLQGDEAVLVGVVLGEFVADVGIYACELLCAGVSR